MARKPRDPMVSHFCVTLWRDQDGEPILPDDECFDAQPVLDLMISTAKMCRAHYGSWSIEDARLDPKHEKKEEDAKIAKLRDQGKAPAALHLHLYFECERSIRWSTVRNRFQRVFQGAHVEARRGWRDSAREYHMGIQSNGSEKPSRITSGEFGEWRPDSSSEGGLTTKEEVAALIVQHGANPRDIAIRYPSYYIGNGIGVIRLWEAINRRKWGHF